MKKYTLEQVKKAANGSVFRRADGERPSCRIIVFQTYMQTACLYHNMSGGGFEALGNGWENEGDGLFTLTNEKFNGSLSRSFPEQTVKLNDEYDATVAENGVKVGCQTIAFDKVKELYAAVMEGEKFIEDNR